MKIPISAFIGWFSALESRKIGVLYLVNTALFFLAGITAALLIQLDMLSPAAHLMSPQKFGTLLSGHGMLMVFVVLLPLFPGVFGHLLFPASVGPPNKAMRNSSLAGWLCHLVGGSLVTVALLLGVYDNGWAMMVPVTGGTAAMIALVTGLGLSALAALLPCIVIVRTAFAKKYRTTPFRQFPLFSWFFLFGALVHILITPIRLLTLILMIGGRLFGWSTLALTQPDGIWRYQQLFWMYVGPATFGLVLFAVGLVFELLAARTSESLRARTLLVSSGIAMAIFGIASWGKHFIGVADSEVLVTIGSMCGLMIIPPAVLILLRWSRALVALRSPFGTPELFVLGAALWFAMTLALGATLAIPSLGVHLHGTYFTVAHLHIALSGMILSAFLAALFHFWPVWWQTRYSHRSGSLCALGVLCGIGLSFVPMIFLGALGLPRALHIYPKEFSLLHTLSSVGSLLLVVSLLGSAILLVLSAIRGRLTGSVTDTPSGEFSSIGLAVRETERRMA